MEEKVVYKCEGTCGGVSDTPGTCQAEDCTHYGKSLSKHDQCEDCVGKSKESGKAHGCDCCTVAS